MNEVRSEAVVSVIRTLQSIRGIPGEKLEDIH